jgi:hypothetical protein
MLAAMRLKTPDRVPLMAPISFGFVLVQNPFIDPVDLWHNHENSYTKALCNISKRFRFDGVRTPHNGVAPLDRSKVNFINQKRNETVVNFKNGDSCTFCKDDLPRYNLKLAPEMDFDKFNPDSIPEKFEYYPVSTRCRLYTQETPAGCVSEIRQARDIIGPDYSVHASVYSPEDYLIDLFGLEGAMMAMLTDPDKCKEILIRFAKPIIGHLKKHFEDDVDAICTSAPFTGQTFISTEMYEQIIAPVQKIIVDECKTNNVPCYCHTCGSINDRLELMVDIGFDGIECLDPPPLGNINLEDAVKRIGDRAFIKGNIDPVNVLLNGSTGLIQKDVMNRLKIGMRARGGFILSTACSIAPHTPPENLDVLYEMIEKYGHY